MTDAQPAEKTLWPLEHVIEWLKSAEMKRTTPKTHPFESDMMPDELQRDAARHLEILTRRIRELEGELRTAAKVPVDPTYAKDCYILRLERERDEARVRLADHVLWSDELEARLAQAREALDDVLASGANSHRNGNRNDDVVIARAAYEALRALARDRGTGGGDA